MTTRLVIGNKNYSSWSLRAWLALRKAGALFEEVRIPLDTPQFEAQVGRYSPTGTVPVLHDQGLVVWDSLAICEYANERFAAGRLWPAGREARAQARAACAEMHAGFEPLREALPMNCRATGRKVEIDAAVTRDVARIQALWSECRAQHGAAGPWLFGAFSIADCYFAPVVFRFRGYGVPVAGAVEAYCKAVLADPDVKDWQRAAEEEDEVIAAEEVGE